MILYHDKLGYFEISFWPPLKRFPLEHNDILRWTKNNTVLRVCIVQYLAVFLFYLAKRVNHPGLDWNGKETIQHSALSSRVNKSSSQESSLREPYLSVENKFVGES